MSLFEHAENWRWLGLAAGALIVAIAGERRRFRAARQFGPQPRSRTMSWLTIAAESSACVLLVAALADPRWGRETRTIPEPQVQVVVALDVSRSMHAEDAQPSRAVKARELITNWLAERTQERVALVKFAGTARVVIPLTRDLAELQRALLPDPTENRLVGGSELVSAFRAAREAFLRRLPGERVLIVVSDGEDQQSTPPSEIAAIVADCHCSVLLVGVGDPVGGAPIPIGGPPAKGEYLKYHGETVISRRNDKLLAAVADATGGVYQPIDGDRATRTQCYRERIEPLLGETKRNRQANVRVSRFSWFLAAALGMLAAAYGVIARPRFSLSRSQFPREKRFGATSVSAALIVAVLGVGATSDELLRRANRDFRAGRFDEALAGYQRAIATGEDAAPASFNQAVVHYRLGDRDAARAQLEETLVVAEGELLARTNFLMGNCDYADVVAGALTKDQSITLLQQAIGHYRDAVAVEPNWSPPRANIELASLLIDQIRAARESRVSKAAEADPQATNPTSKGSKPPDNKQPGEKNEPSPKVAGDQPDSGRQESGASGKQTGGNGQAGRSNSSSRNGKSPNEKRPSPTPDSAHSSNALGGSNATNGESGSGPKSSGRNPPPRNAGDPGDDRNGGANNVSRDRARQRLQQILNSNRDREARQSPDNSHGGRGKPGIEKDW